MEVFFNPSPIQLTKNIKLHGLYQLDIELDEKKLFTHIVIYEYISNYVGTPQKLTFLIGHNKIDNEIEDICLKLDFEISKKSKNGILNIQHDSAKIDILTKNNLIYQDGKLSESKTLMNQKSDKSCLLEDINGTVKRYVSKNFLETFINLACEISLTIGCRKISLQEAPNKGCKCESTSCEKDELISLVLPYAFRNKGENTFYGKYGFKSDESKDFLNIIKNKSTKKITDDDKEIIKILFEFEDFKEEETVSELTKRSIDNNQVCKSNFLKILQFFYLSEKNNKFLTKIKEEVQKKEGKTAGLDYFNKFYDKQRLKTLLLEKEIEKTPINILSLKKIEDAFEDIEKAERRKLEIAQYISDSLNLVLH